jgi:transcriptional regulator with PAS, ATPase and Fis domain
VKLLRVLEERVIERVGDNRPVPVDVRILSATNRDLAAMVRAGSFREDLFYRINVLPVTIPPVRERPGDVPLLAESFLRKMQLRTGRDIRAISAAAMHLLMTYPWPGNVRELRSTFEYAFVTCQGLTIEPEHLPPPVRQGGAPSLPGPVRATVAADSRAERQRRELIEALTQAGGNQSRAAELLGVSRVTVWNRMKRYGVRAERQVRE